MCVTSPLWKDSLPFWDRAVLYLDRNTNLLRKKWYRNNVWLQRSRERQDSAIEAWIRLVNI
jgi:hypothetical protein